MCHSSKWSACHSSDRDLINHRPIRKGQQIQHRFGNVFRMDQYRTIKLRTSFRNHVGIDTTRKNGRYPDIILLGLDGESPGYSHFTLQVTEFHTSYDQVQVACPPLVEATERDVTSEPLDKYVS